jgi:hypothetical protein
MPGIGERNARLEDFSPSARSTCTATPLPPSGAVSYRRADVLARVRHRVRGRDPAAVYVEPSAKIADLESWIHYHDDGHASTGACILIVTHMRYARLPV